jgi:hypothetical protein
MTPYQGHINVEKISKEQDAVIFLINLFPIPLDLKWKGQRVWECSLGLSDEKVAWRRRYNYQSMG